MNFFLYSLFLILIFFVLPGFRVVNQYERAIVLTFGKYSDTREPGLNWIIPLVQQFIKIDIRITAVDIPQQEAITKDNVPVGINAVVYFHVLRAEDAYLKVQNYTYAVSQYAQAALRDVIGGVELDSLLTERDTIANEIKQIVDKATEGWGINVEAIKIQDIEIPADMKRAMAKQAESERERRAVIIRAEGELSAAENLKKAMDKFATSGAISLRTLQTIEATTANPANTIIFALPIEIIEGFKKLAGK
ncbi:MAG: slipin family protein [Candidatus Nealsonbacteria bacterium]|nr:slipin family protein [Candidatus Nealsonbacteria bacterium]